MSECSSMILEGANYHDKKFCRNFEYYIDSGSKYWVELGNWKYPYKNLNSAMIEIFNQLSENVVASVNIYFKENTINEV